MTHRIFESVLRLSARQVAVQLFLPVAIAGLLYVLGYPLAAFLVFQLFIEAFAVWQFSIGFTLSDTATHARLRRVFIFNMIFAILYRLGTNGYQAWFFTRHQHFPPLEKLYWVIPIHLYATLGIVYCFYLNARWMIDIEKTKGIQSDSHWKNTFLQLLIFPYGLWYIQPRLNRIVGKSRQKIS